MELIDVFESARLRRAYSFPRAGFTVTARARNRRRAVVRGGPRGRCRLSSEAAAVLRTASRLFAAEQRGVAEWLASPAMRVVRISDVALPVAGLRGGRRRRSRLGGLRRSQR